MMKPMSALHDIWSYQIKKLKSYDSLAFEKRSASEFRVFNNNLLLSANLGLENAVSLIQSNYK